MISVGENATQSPAAQVAQPSPAGRELSLDDVYEDLEELGLSEDDVAAAVAWARQNA